MPALPKSPAAPSLFDLLFADAPKLSPKTAVKPKQASTPCPDCDLRLAMSL